MKHQILISTSLICCAVFILTPEVSNSYKLLKSYESEISNYKQIVNKEDYILTAMSDKYLFSIANIITWWPSWNEDKFFDPLRISNLIKSLIKSDKIVYVQISSRLDQNKLTLLSKYGINFVQVEKNLYRARYN